MAWEPLIFLPYYYPPWFAMLTVALVPLGYYGGKVTWFVLIADLVLLTGYLLRKTIPGVPAGGPDGRNSHIHLHRRDDRDRPDHPIDPLLDRRGLEAA